MSSAVAETGKTLIEDVITQVETIMDERGVTRSELAVLMGVTPGYISHLFVHKQRNLTLRSLAKIAAVLGAEVTVTFTPLPD